jgi:hypothetical protein
MAGLVPAIHVFHPIADYDHRSARKTWMLGTRPSMTVFMDATKPRATKP